MKFTKQEIRNLKRLCDAVSKVKDSKLKDGGWYSTEYIKIKSVNDITLSNIVKAVKKVVRIDVKKNYEWYFRNRECSCITSLC